MGVCCEGVKGGARRLRLFSLPPCRRRSGETPAAHKQIRIEKSSHKTHLIQLMQQMRCVSFAKYATEKGRRTRRYTAP